MAAVIATAVDIATFQTTIYIVVVALNICPCSDRSNIFTCRSTDGVPFQYAVAIFIADVNNITIIVFHDVVICISLNLPAHGLNLQATEVKYQLVADSSCRRTFRNRGGIT